MNAKLFALLTLMLTLLACEDRSLIAVGQLESDRVELVAEFAEPITAIAVTEGDILQVGDEIVRQSTARIDIQITEAEANIARLQALLDEQVNGVRPETIAVVVTSLQEATVEREFRDRELQRLSRLRAQNLTSVESVDNAQRLLDAAIARVANVNAQLDELRAGTRAERLEQTRHQIRQAQAQLAALQLNRDRLLTTAPQAGIVDSLPFEVGERPRQGDVVAVLLAGSQPFARLYIPESVRASVQVGTTLSLAVDGVEPAIQGTVRRIANEPAFTPYFALTERDRGRLSYVAEVSLPERQPRLPEGLPVQVVFE